MTSDEYKATKITVAAGLIGALIGGLASFGCVFTQSWFQMRWEVAKVRAEVITQDRKDFLSKSEKLFSTLSDLYSFFDANNTFEKKQAKTLIAQARKAAYEFAVYSPQKMGLISIKAVEVVNQAIESDNPKQLKESLDGIAILTKELVETFLKERAALNNIRNKALE